MLSKNERLQIFLQRLNAAKCASSAEEAITLVRETLNGVEDEFFGVSYNPNLWQTAGRMYPPQKDNFRTVPGCPSLGRNRNRRHNTFIGRNGSIRIETTEQEILLEKAGCDGRETHHLAAGDHRSAAS